MANILTATEAANVLRCDEDDPTMLDLLPQVDAYIQNATGRDWTIDDPVHPVARAAARLLLVKWHEDPGELSGNLTLTYGLAGVLVQLEALALQIGASGLPDEPLALARTNLQGEMAPDASLVLLFNHAMTVTAPLAIRLADVHGNTLSSTNSLDRSGKILTVRPSTRLAAGAAYTLVLDHPADVFGQTLDQALDFWVAG